MLSFIESLSAKVHPTPPNIDTLSNLFQDFYTVASTHISTHISALATRQMRETSPAAAARTTPSKSRGKAKSVSGKDAPSTENGEGEQRMLTPQELTDRRKARRALEQKRARLEEAVERRLCEGIYARIYRHQSTQDEAQDAKLRSKTTALSLVGINLADLGVDLDDAPSKTPEKEAAAASKIGDIKEALEPARKEFVLMHEKRYPLGKLNHLKAVHRSIVDVLSAYRPSASADEIMPMMIFTLITLPPENLHVISDARFIQNFRWEQKLNGEAAYCLTTLEAAISFLQTVDLSTLRADELPSGPTKAPSHPNTPRAETFPPAYNPSLASGPQDTSGDDKTATKSAGLRPPAGRSRRISDLVNTPAQAINAASDSLLNTADQSLKNISTSLGESYNFLLGKLRERQAAPEASSLVVPKTLDDARKLVSTPPPEDDSSVSGASEIHVGDVRAQATTEEEGRRRSTPEDRILAFIGGKKTVRERSVEASSRSASRGSGKRVASGEEGKEKEKEKGHGTGAAGVNPLESMRNLGNSLNPMARLSSMGVMRGFGRSAPGTPGKEGKESSKEVSKGHAEGGDLATVSLLSSSIFSHLILLSFPHSPIFEDYEYITQDANGSRPSPT